MEPNRIELQYLGDRLQQTVSASRMFECFDYTDYRKTRLPWSSSESGPAAVRRWQFPGSGPRSAHLRIPGWGGVRHHPAPSLGLSAVLRVKTVKTGPSRRRPGLTWERIAIHAGERALRQPDNALEQEAKTCRVKPLAGMFRGLGAVPPPS